MIAGAGGEARAVHMDVSEEASITAGFAEALDRLGGLDILVSNAGVILEKPLLETSGRGLRLADGREPARRLSGRPGRSAAMTAQGTGGRVINIASDLGYFGREDFSAYCASKAGVLTLTRSWAKEFAPDILVNAIAPGPIDTDMLGPEAMSPEWREKEAQIPLARLGQPEEIAAAALFLAGPGSSFMTGQALDPNGGSLHADEWQHQ